MLSPPDALDRLREGNRRFVSGVPRLGTLARSDRRSDVLANQRPIAAILGCSDSRVPVEIVFDQGFGDLFVIRVAGNIAAPSQIGSIEFATELFGTRLVVVLGHTHCGAVQATVDELHRPTGHGSTHRHAITEWIHPALDGLLPTEVEDQRDDLLRRAVRANVRFSVSCLRNESEPIRRLIANHELLVVGAEYCLETGVVDFFEGVPG